MAQIFPAWTNRVPIILVLSIVVGGGLLTVLAWYYGSPQFTDAGYRPVQPVPYSHKLHAGDLGLDCRYCHSTVEVSPVAAVPPTQVCMNCHTFIKLESEKLAQVRDSFKTGEPVEWIRVHKLPDFVYFDHSIHLHAGVGCATCHGNVAEMEEVTQKEPLNMAWCLDCHRNPAPNLRPLDQITNMKWMPPENQEVIGAQFIQERNINPPVDCFGCHR